MLGCRPSFHVTGVLIRRGETQTCIEGRLPCEDEDRNWSDAAVNQGTPKIVTPRN